MTFLFQDKSWDLVTPANRPETIAPSLTGTVFLLVWLWTLCALTSIFKVFHRTFSYCTYISFLSGLIFSQLCFHKKSLKPVASRTCLTTARWVSKWPPFWAFRKELAKSGRYISGSKSVHILSFFTSVIPHWSEAWILLFYNCSPRAFLVS